MIKQWADKAIGLGIGLIASLLMRSAIKPLLCVDEFNVFCTKITDFPRSTEAANSAFTYQHCIGVSGQKIAE